MCVDSIADRRIFSHACLDRYYELWQTLNPTAPWEENQAGAATVDHALVPFSRSEPDGTWTSRMIQFVDSSKLPKYARS